VTLLALSPDSISALRLFNDSGEIDWAVYVLDGADEAGGKTVTSNWSAVIMWIYVSI
jgi:hypothetical protein